MTDGSLSSDAMRQLVDSGDAKALLVGFEVGPTRYADAWWYVPSDAGDGADYVVAGPDMSAEFDRLQARSDKIDALLAEPGRTDG